MGLGAGTAPAGSKPEFLLTSKPVSATKQSYPKSLFHLTWYIHIEVDEKKIGLLL